MALVAAMKVELVVFMGQDTLHLFPIQNGLYLCIFYSGGNNVGECLTNNGGVHLTCVIPPQPRLFALAAHLISNNHFAKWIASPQIECRFSNNNVALRGFGLSAQTAAPKHNTGNVQPPCPCD